MKIVVGIVASDNENYVEFKKAWVKNISLVKKDPHLANLFDFYFLYSDSTRTTNWGNTSGTWVSATGTGVAQVMTVYGRIPANESALIGNYSDTVTVTITF